MVDSPCPQCKGKLSLVWVAANGNGNDCAVVCLSCEQGFTYHRLYRHNTKPRKPLGPWIPIEAQDRSQRQADL